MSLLRAEGLLCLFLVLVGCGSGANAADAASDLDSRREPNLELMVGTGRDDYLELDASGTLVLDRGPQGLQHVYVSVRAPVEEGLHLVELTVEGEDRVLLPLRDGRDRDLYRARVLGDLVGSRAPFAVVPDGLGVRVGKAILELCILEDGIDVRPAPHEVAASVATRVEVVGEAVVQGLEKGADRSAVVIGDHQDQVVVVRHPSRRAEQERRTAVAPLPAGPPAAARAWRRTLSMPERRAQALAPARTLPRKRGRGRVTDCRGESSLFAFLVVLGVVPNGKADHLRASAA